MSRGLPPPTELSREFWDAAAEHRLVVPRCEKCAQCFFPPERLCPACGSDIWSGADCAGTGSLVAFTVVHRAPSPDFDVPYVVAVVALDEGCELLTNLVLDESNAAVVGMPVRVAFLDQPDGRALPVFMPRSSAQQEES
ncbi:MAG TPA: OB-fold domain-containing protein [Actinomycetes bacterium]|nr:OB-fold domain-containing protein [Actinomycetes bacterium]